jgi:hypothetical protein
MMARQEAAKNMPAEPGSTVESPKAAVLPAAGRRVETNNGPRLTAVEQPVDAPRLAAAQATLSSGLADAHAIEMAEADIEAFAAQQRLDAATTASDATGQDKKTSSGKSKKHGWRKPAIITGLLASTALVVSGCMAWFGARDVKPSTIPSDAPTAGMTEPPTPSNSATPTIRITPLPTEKPTPVAAVFTQNPDGGITWKGSDKSGKEVDLGVPSMESYGLKAEPKDGKVIYTAEAGNKVGLEAGAYGGEYQPYVSIDGKLTGGESFVPQVVLQLIKDKLATIPNQADKWIATVPLDIRGATADTDLNITFIKGFDTYAIGIASISFNGELPVTNIIPGSTQAKINKNSYYNWLYFNHDRRPIDSLSPTNPISDLMVGGPFEGVTDLEMINATFGETVCTATGPIIVTETAGADSKDITSKNMLYVAGPDGSNVPVGVAK